MSSELSEIERAKVELEILKLKERSLEQKLGQLDQQERDGKEQRIHQQKPVQTIMGETLPQDLLIFDSSFQSEFVVNAKDLPETIIDDFDEDKDEDYDDDDDDDESVKDEQSEEELENLYVTGTSLLDYSQDNEESSPIDHRDDIFHDIREAKERERLLKEERGEYSEESAGETTNEEVEDSREKILREIEEEKLRELELQAKYRDDGLMLNESYDEFEKTKLKDSFEPREMIAMEINELHMREEELRHQQEESTVIKIRSTYADPRQRMEKEISMQQEREKELREKMRASVSFENLLFFRDDGDEEDQAREKPDPRGMILREIDDIQQREKELRERMQQQFEQQQLQMEMEEVMRREELEKQQELERRQKEARAKQKREEYEKYKQVHAMEARSKIKREIAELQEREEELKKRYFEIQKRKQQVTYMLNAPDDKKQRNTATYTQVLQNSLLGNNVMRMKKDSSREKKKVSERGFHMHPIAVEWETKAEEEKVREMIIQQEVQQKREERHKMMLERHERERIIREKERRAEEEKQRVLRDRAILRLKQQGLNELWTARLPVVTLENNRDAEDLHLLQNPRVQQKNGTYLKPSAETTIPITLSKTIKKWERRIKRNSNKQ